MTTDLRQHSAASERNRVPIRAVLERYLPKDDDGLVLEVASGTGQHTAFFAAAFKNLTFQPSDLNEDAHESINAWIAHEGVSNVRPPMRIDATDIDPADLELDAPVVAMVNINMIHISPWAACEGLMSAGGRVLPSGAHLFMYGPYVRGGGHTAPSNAAFDDSLRARNREWGIRHLEEVVACADSYGLEHADTIEMPANNLTVVYRRR
jgi:hypothetical protein